MSVFETLRKQVLDAVQQHVGGDPAAAEAAAHPGLFDGVVAMIRDRGLGSMAESLKAGGLSEAVSSWVGKGANLPVSADQLRNALGSDTISALAAKAGLSSEQVSAALSKLLPGLMDKLTPNGLVDDSHAALLDAQPATEGAPASDWDNGASAS
jgi:uncharacterized protein YidB (DUF937 family)